MKSRCFFMTFVTLCMLCNYSFSAPIKKGKDTKGILVNHAKLQLQDMMLDPESIRLKITAISVQHKRVCGEVNSKNRMGGYVGFLPFFYSENPLDLGEGQPFYLGIGEHEKDDDFLSKLANSAIRDFCLRINEI